jgi:predicted RNA binding protein YcfA (HicA-like mRNA interferase family)
LKTYSSREIIKILIENGWYLAYTTGSHQQYKHPAKKGKVTVPHPKKNIPIKTARSIFKQAGIKIE